MHLRHEIKIGRVYRIPSPVGWTGTVNGEWYWLENKQIVTLLSINQTKNINEYEIKVLHENKIVEHPSMPVEELNRLILVV